MQRSRLFSRSVPLILFLVLLAGTVVAGPPFVTDDPEPVEYHNWEFYIASIQSKYNGDWSGTAPHLELNYGVVSNVQLHLITPMAYDAPPEDRAARLAGP